MTKNRPITTLFALMSVDGKITTGSVDDRDFDKDLRLIKGVSEGLQQYYDLEQKTDIWSLNTGRVQAKVGVNERGDAEKTAVNFIVIDNKPHLTESGMNYFIKRSATFLLVTTNTAHPAFKISADNLHILHYKDTIDFKHLFERLRSEYHIEAITIQSGGTLNATLLREGLIDHVSVVVAPCLIGGNDTATLIDGTSLVTSEDLSSIRPLILKKCDILEHSYVHLFYDIVNSAI